jgi:hypothetical protein
MRIGLLAAFGALLALVAPCLAQAGPGLLVGAVEDDLRASTPIEAEARMAAFRLDGFRAVRVTSYWRPGMTRPTDEELTTLGNVSDAGARNGVQVFVTVMSPGSATTPLTAEARADFASYAAAVVRGVPTLTRVIIGNEPNLNRFWLPQFDLEGASAAPAAYVALLARTYDAIKEASPDVRVYGGAISPRGTDRPNGTRPTHSPTTFIQGMGVAYRASGRERPLMDALSIHVYGDNSSVAPTVAHPLNTSIGVADYDKLVRLLGEAFDGTAQAGSELPILYGEYGVESEIPASKSALYTGTEPATTRPVSEATQATYYRQALTLAFCQPNVESFLLFLANDERGRANWQSGIRYADGTPKSSRASVRKSLNRTAGGSITRCPGVELPVHATTLTFGTRSAARRGVFRTSFSCDLDCRYWIRVENAVTHATKLQAKGAAEVGELVRADLGRRRLAPGTYRYTIRLVHPVNPAAPTVRAGPRFRLP